MTDNRAGSPGDSDVPYTVLSPRAVWTAAGLLLLLTAAVATGLLFAYGKGGDQQANQLEAIKTTATIVLGAGGAAALLLAARRQRSTEIALKQADRSHAAAEADAASRRITELYSKAADHLGSDKAPVRLAGLFALERLAQDNPDQRQSTVYLLCAYLRMPFELPEEPAADRPGTEAVRGAEGQSDAPTATAVAAGAPADDYRNRVQELEVRLTAQEILATHLRPGDAPDKLLATFWANIDLYLFGATLVYFSLTGCRPRHTDFRRVTFTGDASFDSATFTGNASFRGATFTEDAYFTDATFTGDASFNGATFRGNVPEEVARFLQPAGSAPARQQGTVGAPG